MQENIHIGHLKSVSRLKLAMLTKYDFPFDAIIYDFHGTEYGGQGQNSGTNVLKFLFWHTFNAVFMIFILLRRIKVSQGV